MIHPTLSLIESIAEQRAHVQNEPHRLMRLFDLQRWQVQRLQLTYADYYDQPRYREAIEFFANDLYGPHDYTGRDRDLKRVLEPWQRILPRRALHAVTAALELEALTLRLDIAMLEALPDDIINAEHYAIAYRNVDRRDERQRQIVLIVSCGRALESLVANPWVHRALRLAKVPAKLAGVVELHEFLERGYAAFLKMDGAKELLNAIEQRETAIMDNLFANQSEPFRVTTSDTPTNATAPI